MPPHLTRAALRAKKVVVHTIHQDPPNQPTDQEVMLLGADSLNQAEREMLHALMTKSGKLDLVIPADAPLGDVWESLRLCCKVYSGLKESADRIKPIIGKLLLEMRNRPGMYKALHYASFNDFMTRGMPEVLGLCRSDAYDMLRVATNLPFVTMEDWRTIGFRKLQLLAHPAVVGRAEEILTAIKDKPGITANGVKQLIEDKSLVEKGELDFVTVAISMTKQQRDEFREFCEDDLIQAFAQTSSPARLIIMAFQECRSHWMAQGIDAGPQ